ncbi:MAG: glycosyltransferase [Atopobiaceae bacterium]|nr:glycosyltransferase [Atopobiaceae bacterium]
MKTKRQEPFAKACALCRGEGLGYVVLRGSREAHEVKATAATKAGTSIPCTLYSVTAEWQRDVLAPGASFVWVVAVPLLACDCVVRVEAAGESPCEVTFSAVRSKLMSRFLATTKPETAAILRGFERREGYGRIMVRILEAWPGNDETAVWRIRATLPWKETDTAVGMRVYDGAGNPLRASIVAMEDQIVPSKRNGGWHERLVSFSCTIPKDVRSFFVVVYSEADGCCGFDAINAPRAAAMLDGTESLANGSANDWVYEGWFASHRATVAELARQRKDFHDAGERLPILSLVVCVDVSNASDLSRTVASVRAQSYGAWELVVVCQASMKRQLQEAICSLAEERMRVMAADQDALAHIGVEAAKGSYVGLVGCGDVLEPDTLWQFAQMIAEHPQVDLLYCDEDKLEGTRVTRPSFKTFPNYGKLYEYNYFGRLMLVSSRALAVAEPMSAGFGPAYEYELALRVYEVAHEVLQVPRVLYHQVTDYGWSSQDQEKGKCALAAHLKRRGVAAQVVDGVQLGCFRVCYELPEPAIKVSVVIPTRDHADLLETCVHSILKKTTYANYEVILVENNSAESQTFELYEKLQNADGRVRVVAWEPPEPGAFNYSAIVNFGVAHTAGEIVVLLNNDTEVIEPHWMHEMLGCLMRPEVGVVGAKLLFGDGLIQHVGMAANPDGGFCHVCQNLTSEEAGPSAAATMPGDYCMVTGACQMMRKSLFEELGGYDEELAVGFNDGDFCLRAREAGFAVTVCARAQLHHREFSSRGRESTDTRLQERFMRERARTMLRHAAFFAQGDPVRNPNLDPFGGYFTLRPE